MTYLQKLIAMLPFSPEGAWIIVRALPRQSLIDRIKRSPNITREEAAAAVDVWDKLETAAKLLEAYNKAQDELEDAPVVAESPRMVMTTKDAAEVLGVNQSRVRQWVGNGTLHSISGNPNKHLFDPEEVRELAFSRRGKAA